MNRVAITLLFFAVNYPVMPCVAQQSGLTSFTQLIKQVEPAVVRIDVQGPQGEAVGSGFVVEAEGLVVTNHHVVAGSNSAEVVFQDGSKAKVLGSLVLDAGRDIAVIRIEKGDYQTLQLAKELPEKGATVMAFGAPQGLSFSATEGIISSIRDVEELKEYTSKTAGTWIQTSTPISPGNSGGPLVNKNGEVVGANTMGMLHSQNINFAISSVDIQEALTQAKGKQIVALSEGAGKQEQDVPISMLTGRHLSQAVDKLAVIMLTSDMDSTEVKQIAMVLLQLDPNKITDPKVRSNVAKGFKRLAYGDKFSFISNSDLGIRGMAMWGGKHSLPYFVELLDTETFHGSEAIYEVLSESDDPKASEAIARRLSNFFDRKRALAALRRMGPRAEPGLIKAVPSGDLDICLVAIELLSEHGTEASVPILTKASKKGVPAVRVAAKRALTKVRTRERRAAQAAEQKPEE